MPEFNPLDWYWIVNGSAAQVYSSAVGDYVPVGNETYQAWLTAGAFPTRIASEAELGEVLAQYQLRPVAANVLDGYRETHSRKITLEIVAKLLFAYANEIRALKGQAPINASQFRAYVKDLM